MTTNLKFPHRRQFLHLAAGAAALPAVSRIARAQGYPARPVRLIVGFPPGGGTGINACLIGQSLLERLGQPLVIESPRCREQHCHRGGRTGIRSSGDRGEHNQCHALRQAQFRFHPR
jgi:hypothetical protein